MPGRLQRNSSRPQFGRFPSPSSPLPPPPLSSSSSCDSTAVFNRCIWSSNHANNGGLTFDQLQKFWTELPHDARQKLMRIDKQTLIDQARKNLYCSRCRGMLLECFSQIVMYGKSLQHEDACLQLTNRKAEAEVQLDKDPNDVSDPSIHPWGGLTTTKDGVLTLLNCFIDAKSLQALQNVFDCARAREHERELLYPDACGGGGRGWINQGMANYGRGHLTREICALHTARLSCDTLVGFWSALSDETRSSLLRIKEEDFIERLMYRFDSKRFCRDCRRNVVREFKELKELKRLRKEPLCTSNFCVADTAFQYEVSENMVQVDWNQSFTDTVGTYDHFEWAIGTAEGKCDILGFEDVGMNGKVQVNGLELGGLSECYITLRAWRPDGIFTELSVKAHALKGQSCVHRRLIVGDGFVTIRKGESIRSFFEHAEEVEEDEDDDTIDKDGNELDGEGPHPQKHAKSPELAREFLLDAATVIFKEQVEKAFKEGTARQNSHSIFVYLALQLLEERVHVACKEVITSEKQIKLLEEEEKEKQKEEERKERRRTKDREKKARRKERLRGKNKDREGKDSAARVDDSSMSIYEELPSTLDSVNSISDPGDTKDEQSSDICIDTDIPKDDNHPHQCHVDREHHACDGKDSFVLEQSKSSRRKSTFRKDSAIDEVSKCFDKGQSAVNTEDSVQYDEWEAKLHICSRVSSRSIDAAERPWRGNPVKINVKSCSKLSEKFDFSSNRLRDTYDIHLRGSHENGRHRAKTGYHVSSTRTGTSLDTMRLLSHNNKHDHGRYIADNSTNLKAKPGNIAPIKNNPRTKLVWEPTDASKKFNRDNSIHGLTLMAASKVDELEDAGFAKDENADEPPYEMLKAPDHDYRLDHNNRKSTDYLKDTAEEVSLSPVNSVEIMRTSNSDNRSSCLSKGGSTTGSSIARNLGSSSSDSEDASQQSDGRKISTCTEDFIQGICDDSVDPKFRSNVVASSTKRNIVASFQRDKSPKTVFDSDSRVYPSLTLGFHKQNIQVPPCPPCTVRSLNQGAASWSPLSPNRLVTLPQHTYVYPASPAYAVPLHSEFPMQYDSLWHSTTPMVTVGQHSLCQATKNNGSYRTKEQANGATEQKPTSNGSHSSKPPMIQNGSAISSANSHYDGTFSLFHFGGPVAGIVGHDTNPIISKENTREFSSQLPAVQGDFTCSKKEATIQEYSLFAANKGTRFSIF